MVGCLKNDTPLRRVLNARNEQPRNRHLGEKLDLFSIQEETRGPSGIRAKVEVEVEGKGR